MKFTSTFVAVTSFLATYTLAMPAPRAPQCHPNFMGRPVSVLAPSQTLEWGQGTLGDVRALSYQTPTSDGEFKIEFTGDPDQTYYIKANNYPPNNLYAGQGPRSNIIAWYQSDNGISGWKWDIACDWCSPNDAWSTHGPYATGCNIVLRGLCATEYPSPDYPRMSSCQGIPQESFDFILP